MTSFELLLSFLLSVRKGMLCKASEINLHGIIFQRETFFHVE